MSARSPTENENADSVMPARIAGIQACKDAPETSMLTWIPALHPGMTQLNGSWIKLGETPLATFSKELQGSSCKTPLTALGWCVYSAFGSSTSEFPGRFNVYGQSETELHYGTP